MKIVCLGDSLTYGYGVNRKECWVSILSEESNYEFINSGINGQISSDIYDRFRSSVIIHNPNYVIITAGVNDFIFGTNNQYAAIKNIKKMILEAKSAKIIPVIGIPLPIVSDLADKFWNEGTNYEGINGLIISYKNLLIELAINENIDFIDFYTPFRLLLDDNNNPSLYYSDGIHPTALGHKIMSEIVINSNVFQSLS